MSLVSWMSYFLDTHRGDKPKTKNYLACFMDTVWLNFFWLGGSFVINSVNPTRKFCSIST